MPKNDKKSTDDFWSDIPTSKYKSLTEYQGQTIRVYGVGDFVGTFSECFVLYVIPETVEIFTDYDRIQEVLVTKSDNPQESSRDMICEKARSLLGDEHNVADNLATEKYVALTVQKRGRFNALERPVEL